MGNRRTSAARTTSLSCRLRGTHGLCQLLDGIECCNQFRVLLACRVNGALHISQRRLGHLPKHFLHVACERAHLGCVKILLEARADVSAMCEATQHETPVDLAWRSTIQGGSPSPSRLPSNSPSRPSSSGGLSRAESTASVSLDPTGFIGAGVTPLFVAAASVDCAELIQLLLEANADVDQASQATLQTPLMVAAMAGHVQVCKSLLKGKADLERTSVFGSSPQELAERCRSLATIKLLKEAAYLLRETGTAEHCGQTLTASEELNLRVTGV